MVGVYNQFLQTWARGERHMGMAPRCSPGVGHEVEIITHVPVVDPLASLDLNSPGCACAPPWLLPFDQLGDLSAEYDLWINASSCPSSLPGPPAPPARALPLPRSTRRPFGRFKRRVAGHIHRELFVPRYGEGFFGPQELGGSRYRWTAGRRVSIRPWLCWAPRGRRAPGAVAGAGALPLRLVLGSFRPAGWGPVPVTVRAGEVVLHDGRGDHPGRLRDAGRRRPAR